jgi:hypothetical protein
MKRFSWIAFVLATLVHLFGTTLLFGAGELESRLNYQGPHHDLALKVWAWIWLPVPMLLKPLLEYFGPRPGEWLPTVQFQWNGYITLLWSPVVGLCCGYLDPRLSWRPHRKT